MALSHQAIYGRLKRVLSEITDVDTSKIMGHMELEASPLGFTSAGKRALASSLNSAFAAEQLALSREQTEAAKFVRDLHDLIYAQIGG